MLKILEIAWLFIALLLVVLCIYNLYLEDYSRVGYLAMLLIVSTVMYFVRRKQRIRYHPGKQDNNR